MTELTFEINSNEEIWELFDKELNSIFIHKFYPNQVIEWWKTDLKTKTGIEFKNLSIHLKKSHRLVLTLIILLVILY